MSIQANAHALASPVSRDGLSSREVLTDFARLDAAIGTELARLDALGILPIWRKKINRSVILRTFQISPEVQAYTKVGGVHFAVYDAILETRGVQSHLEALPAALRKFLDGHARNGSLQFADGKINRSWALKALGAHSPSLTRNPDAKAVLEEFDRRFAHLIPKSNAYPDLAERLRERIRAGNLPVFKDRLHAKGLADDLGVPPSAFYLVPECQPLLDEANQVVRFADPLRPFSDVHERNYNFGELVAFYGQLRTASIAQVFLAVAEGTAAGTAKVLYASLVNALTAIGANGQFEDIVIAIRDDTDPPRARAKECLRWLRGHLGEGKGSIDTVDARITNTRRVLEKVRLLCEGVDVLVPARRGAGRHAPKASLAEAKSDKIEGLSKHLTEYARSQKIDFDQREVQSFLGNLAIAGNLAGLDPSEIPSAIERLNRRRLEQIYDVAVTVFSAGAAEFLGGQERLEVGARQAAEIAALMAQYENGHAPWHSVYAFFADRGELGEEAYLFHIEHNHGGRVPRAAKHLTNAEALRWSRLNKALGGPDALHNKLHLSADAIGAACLMYLISAGANSSVGRTLRMGCVQPSTIAGHKEVIGWKARGGGKPIYNDLRSIDPSGRPTAIEALEFVEKCQPRLARHAPHDADSLFLVDMVGKVKPLPEHTLLAMLRRFAAANDNLNSLDLRVDMLRSSVLLDAALSGDGNLRVAGAIANHANRNVTAQYVEKLPMRILYEAKMRKFQKLFQATIVIGVAGAAKRLGISEAEARTLVGQAVSTGLGRMCLKPLAGIQPGTVKGEPCTRLSACHSCEAVYLIVDAELIADLIIWHASLSEACEELAASRPERFQEEWSDDLAWCESAIEALQRGPARKVFAEALVLAEARRATTGFEAPKPW